MEPRERRGHDPHGERILHGARGVRFRARDPVSGYTHLAGMILGVVGAGALVARARAGSAILPFVVYAASLVALYAASAAYHLAPGRETLLRRLRKLDHAAIFLLIAGTSTPVFWRAFDGHERAAMLGVVWALAAAGVAMRVAWMRAPRALYTSMYVAMGWLVLVKARTAFAALPVLALGLLVAGGVTYTLGALVYAAKRPDPFPRVFGFHEIWHLFVLGGSTLHYGAVLALLPGRF